MTSIEWLISKLGISEITHKKLFEKAKKNHKQEIIDAHSNGYKNLILGDDKVSEQYFAETYGSKGSDGHELDDDIPPTSQYFLTSSQTEISDEMIDNKAKQINLKFGASFAHGFILGVQWYREQIKTK